MAGATLKSNEMLGTQQGVRFLGQRYGVAFIGLMIVGVVLVIVLVQNFPDFPGHIFSADFRADWVKVLIIFTLLSITLTAAAVTVYSYFATKEKLVKVQTAAKAILESLVGGVLTLDTQGAVTIINRAASQILELGTELPYSTLDELSQRHGTLVGLIRNALNARQYVQDQDSVFFNSKDEHVVLRTSISEQVDETGQRVGIVVLVKDVSRLVAMESELRKRDRLAAAGTLAAGVAHEIRNPLSSLELNLRLLRDEVAGLHSTNGELDGYFEILSAETRRLNRITSNFLQLSRPGPLAKAQIQVHDPAMQVVRLLEREAQEKNILFAVDLATDHPVVVADSTKIEQVCLNIMINAMQAMPKGGIIRIASTIGLSEGRRFVSLSFADQGVGIPPENLPRLFDPYFTTRSEGIGLGLAIADRIVTDHGGRIIAESTVDVGTVITVSLPLAEPEITSKAQEVIV